VSAIRVLVGFASKYGATEEIASEIASILSGHGIETVLADLENKTDLEGFDGAVIGSAVYAGHWLKPAQDFVQKNREKLGSIPVWLFSSGPIGDPPMPKDDPVDVRSLLEATLARGHRIFPGKLDKKRLSFIERALVGALRAPEGDFRDWAAVREWAEAIANDMGGQASKS
jgi:menaquinone-dependent protoporphyrinogen oxidase